MPELLARKIVCALQARTRRQHAGGQQGLLRGQQPPAGQGIGKSALIRTIGDRRADIGRFIGIETTDQPVEAVRFAGKADFLREGADLDVI